MLGTAATAFLGITLRCARCHDHKFEPFSQVDYYRMLAVFQPLKRPQDDRTDLDVLVGTEAELAAYRAGLARSEAELARTWDRIERLIKPEIDWLFAPPEKTTDGKPPRKRTALPPELGQALQTEPSKRTQAHWNLIKYFGVQFEAEVRKIAPDEVKAALNAAVRPDGRDQGGPAQGAASRLHLVRGRTEGPADPCAQAGRPDAARRRRRAGRARGAGQRPAGTAKTKIRDDRSPALAGPMADRPRKTRWWHA